MCGKAYSKKYLGFIYVDEMGDHVAPNYITNTFANVLKRNNLRRIRFHDLRHSCASLLIANGVSMKQIQEWLGHSTFKTTADIYVHLEFDSKLSSANALNMGTAFGNYLPNDVQKTDKIYTSKKNSQDRTRKSMQPTYINGLND